MGRNSIKVTILTYGHNLFIYSLTSVTSMSCSSYISHESNWFIQLLHIEQSGTRLAFWVFNWALIAVTVDTNHIGL